MSPIAQKYEALLENAVSGPERIEALNKFARETCRIDTATAMKAAQEAYHLSVEYNFRKGELEARLNLAQGFWLNGDYIHAIDHLGEIVPELNSNDSYLSQNAEAVHLLGAVYSSMEKFEEAENYLKESLELRRKIGHNDGIVRSMNGLGDLYMKYAHYDKALDLFTGASQIEIENESFKGIVIYNIAETSFHIGNYEECARNIAVCLEMGERLEFPLMIIYCKILAAKIHLKDKKPQDAISDLQLALELSKEIENMERVSQILLDLSKAYESAGDVSLAFTFFKEHHELKDKLHARESEARLKAITHRNELEAARREVERERIANLELKEANYTIEAVKNVLAQRNSEITDGIRYARRIQEALLPSDELVNSLFPENFIMYRPKDILSGDFYWVSEATTNYKEKIAMAAVVDCTGHGVPAALMGMIGNNFLRICEHEPTVNRPSEALDFINVGVSNTLRQEYSKSKIRDGMDMTFVAIDYSNMLLHFAGAKNPIYIIRNRELMEFKGDKHPIGAFVGEEMLKFTNHTIPIEKGDCLYMFSDGFADQFGGPRGKKFMYKRFKETLLQSCKLAMSEQYKKLVDAFESWKGELDQIDDVCVMGIRI